MPHGPVSRRPFGSLAAICLAFCGRTFARNFDWYSEQTLWTGAAELVPPVIGRTST